MSSSPLPEISSTGKSVASTTSVEDKVEKAKLLKDKGNEIFKQKKFTKARVQYCTALAYIKGLPGREVKVDGTADPMAQLAASNASTNISPLSPEFAKEVDELESILKTNISTCFLKLEDGHSALKYANGAISINNTSSKAWLRKAEAYLLLKDTEKANEALNEAEKYTSEASVIATINKTREVVAREVRVESQKQKKAFANIFDRLHKHDEIDS